MHNYDSEELIDERLGNIKEIYEELNETNKIDPNTKKLIQDFMDKMDDDSKYIDTTSGKTWIGKLCFQS